MRLYIPLFTALMLAGTANAEIISKDVEYKSGDRTFKGTLVYDDAVSATRPGVVVYPEWWGNNDYAKSRAHDMAEQGYVAFTADMYGEGKTTKEAKQAIEWSGELFKNRELMRERARAAIEVLKGQQSVDASKIALIGFCFGGTNILELARNGENVLGVASFHPSLDFPEDVKKDAVKARVLVFNGAADPMVKFPARQKFIEDMQTANADLEFIEYGNAEHAFTNPEADKYGMDGVAYEPKAEKRSMARLKAFLSDVFSGK